MTQISPICVTLLDFHGFKYLWTAVVSLEVLQGLLDIRYQRTNGATKTKEGTAKWLQWGRWFDLNTSPIDRQMITSCDINLKLIAADPGIRHIALNNYSSHTKKPQYK